MRTFYSRESFPDLASLCCLVVLLSAQFAPGLLASAEDGLAGGSSENALSSSFGIRTYQCRKEQQLCAVEPCTASGCKGSGMSLRVCKLTCEDAASLWPIPSGKSTFGSDAKAINFCKTSFTYEAPEDARDILKRMANNFVDSVNGILRSQQLSSSPSPPSHHKDKKKCLQEEIGVEQSATKLTIRLRVSPSSASSALDTSKEGYTLSIGPGSSNSNLLAKIDAESVYGAHYGLETLSQLIVFDEAEGKVKMLSEASIEDAPFFPHRGVLIDSARNFISVESIKLTLEAMTANKLNRLHWHISDSQAFPLLLPKLPQLAQRSVTSPRAVYTKANVKDILRFANERGVTIIPEIDAPSHVTTQGFSFDPKLLTCAEIDNWQNICPEPPCGQLNVANPRAYEVLRDIYEDVIKMFRTKDLMFHVGGDEVSLPCWNSSSDIQEYLKDKDLAITDPKSFDLLWAEFHNKSRTILETATNSPVGGKAETALRKLLIWESTLTKDANLREKAAIAPDAYTIQLWSKASEGAIKEIVQAGYEVIVSYSDVYYLDCGRGNFVVDANSWCDPFSSWKHTYDFDPLLGVSGADQQKKVLGAEVAMWGELVDDGELHALIWPRAAAMGERLWSYEKAGQGYRRAKNRMMEQRERLVTRGVPAAKLQPESCRVFHHCPEVPASPASSQM